MFESLKNYLLKFNTIIGGINLKSDKKFIERWSKTRLRGKAKYILGNIVSFIVIFFIVVFIGKIIFDEDLYGLNRYFYTSIGVFIGSIISSFISWNNNEKKYNDLVKEKS
jgi:ABC-type multidrug transport system permease subunit